MQALTSALEHDPTLVAAWANRAVLHFDSGNVAASIADLSHALDLSESATVLYNRGLAYQAQNRWQDAIADYTRAFELRSRQEINFTIFKDQTGSILHFTECQLTRLFPDEY